MSSCTDCVHTHQPHTYLPPLSGNGFSIAALNGEIARQFCVVASSPCSPFDLQPCCIFAHTMRSLPYFIVSSAALCMQRVPPRTHTHTHISCAPHSRNVRPRFPLHLHRWPALSIEFEIINMCIFGICLCWMDGSDGWGEMRSDNGKNPFSSHA